MNTPLNFIRIFFTVLSVLFMTSYMISHPGLDLGMSIAVGCTLGLAIAALFVGFDRLLHCVNLRSFNITTVGLFIGYLMGRALVLIFDGVVNLSKVALTFPDEVTEIIHIALFLFGTYLGTVMTLRSSDELYISIPFVQFSTTTEKQNKLLVDPSVLEDTRLIDLCRTGLFNRLLVLPRFAIKELYNQSEIGNDQQRTKAKRSLQVVKNMQEIDGLSLDLNDTDFPELSHLPDKLIRLAHLLEASLLTADASLIDPISMKGIRAVSFNEMSKALKPLMDTGESLTIKIQRYGKEPSQGVGYLEDGSMVVVNGGGDYIGETIPAQVISMKQTSSGRMIFCNLIEHD